MSHFSVLVIGDNIEEQLQPFHEFECTGINDQYIQSVDQLSEIKEGYEGSTTTFYKDAQGILRDPYGDQFYRDPTPEESKQIGFMGGSGCAGGFSYKSKDWGDGHGYRAKVHFKPEDMEEIESPCKNTQSVCEFIEENYSYKKVEAGEQPDFNGKHKYGYYRVNESGELIECFDRTNPNRKWDWWQVGGRYSNRLLLKNGTRTDSAKWGEIDFNAIRIEKETYAANTYDKAMEIFGHLPVTEPWEEVREKHPIDEARVIYHDQPRVKAYNEFLKENQGNGIIGFLDSIDQFNTDRESYIREAGYNSFSTYAVVRDGQWHEKAEMGWFGMDFNEKPNWMEIFHQLTSGIDPETTVTIVDCHI